MDDQDNNPQHELDVQSQRLELERERLKLDSDRVALEKAKERTAKLQLALPILISILALGFNALSERQRSQLEYYRVVSSYDDGRLELFKRMTEHQADKNEIMKSYAEIFARDLVTLRTEQKQEAANLAEISNILPESEVVPPTPMTFAVNEPRRADAKVSLNLARTRSLG